MAGERATLQGKFPGWILGGTALVLAPLLLVAGVGFFWGLMGNDSEEDYEARRAEMGRTDLAMNFMGAGLVVAFLAVPTLANLIAPASPRLAATGAAITMVGLSVQIWFFGIDYVATGIADAQDAAAAQAAMEAGGPTFMLFLAPTVILGWVLLGFAAWRSRLLPWWRAAALGAAGLLPVAAIGGIAPFAIVAYAGLGIATVPLGLSLLRDQDRDQNSVR